jgi:imidazolonepropionase
LSRSPAEIDLFVHGAAELATPLGREPCGGAALGRVRVEPRWGVAIRGQRILAVGPEEELAATYRARRTLSARGGTLVPGFVDAHTHPVFAGTREDEFEQRTAGRSYLEIAASGGGILSSVRGVRAASRETLLELLLARLRVFLSMGTTTLEAKSGYGLSLADEQKSLEVLAQANRAQPIECVPTFLGAHAVPPEYRGRRREYLALLLEEMLPRVAEAGLAEYCDAFTEAHAFDLNDTRRLLERARELGLGLRMHADQLSDLGGAVLAGELGAASADHLEHVSARGIEALVRGGVVPVLCPVVPLYLREEREAPARRLIEAGLAPALSTDFNPGSCYLQSLPEVLAWAALRYRMSAAECLTAATLNAACSLGRGHEIGSLEAGKRADVVLLDTPSHRFLCYELGRNPVRAVVVRGAVAYERPADPAERPCP